jgi:glycosyltransferase involved in cell wall biosynthesis
MKIALFSNQFASQKGHGISRYAQELYLRLNSLHPERSIFKLQVVAAWSDLPRVQVNELISKGSLKLLRTGRKFTPLLWTYFGGPNIEKIAGESWDLVHCLSLGYPISTSGKWIVTIHDLGCLTHPEYFPQNQPWLMRKALKQAVFESKGIICVSNYTAKELIDYVLKEFKVNVSNKLEVIHEGVSEDFFLSTDGLEFVQNSWESARSALNKIGNFSNENDIIENTEKCEIETMQSEKTSIELEKLDRSFEAPVNLIHKLPTKFIFCAAKLSPRKNLDLVLYAMQELDESIQLVIAGGEGWENKSLNEKLEQLNLKSRVVNLGYLTKSELKYCYSKSLAFVYPSFFEGFGLTILEAMACGAPVITSHCTSIPEVAGDAAILIDPKSVNQLVNAVTKLDLNTKYRNEIIVKGWKRAKSMSWSETARKTLEFYDKILASKN